VIGINVETAGNRTEQQNMEHPILFSGQMVRAILDGQKTMTRRIIKPQPGYNDIIRPEAEIWKGLFANKHQRCPYGNAGDYLWVRETWWNCLDNNDTVKYVADGPAPTTDRRHYIKRPSIFLRRHDSRLTLKITDRRIERLLDITDADAISEGAAYTIGDTDGEHSILCPACHGYGIVGPSTDLSADCNMCGSPRQNFLLFWDSLNAKSGYGTAANPLVWVISFERIQHGSARQARQTTAV
jgi:hypothetical protein